MRVNKSWKMSLIGLIILITMVILISTPKVVARAFPPVATNNNVNPIMELVDVDDVIDQVKALDADADAMLVNESGGTVLKVYWSDNYKTPIVIKLISVGDNDFLCRGEDVYSMMVDALNNK